VKLASVRTGGRDGALVVVSDDLTRAAAVPDIARTLAVLIPRILELYRQDRFPLDRLVRTFPLADINTAVAASRAGSVVKAVLQHEH